MKSHDSADATGKATEFLIPLAFFQCSGEKRRGRWKSSSAGVLWERKGARKVCGIHVSLTGALFKSLSYLYVYLFLENLESTKNYKEHNLKTNFIPQV